MSADQARYDVDQESQKLSHVETAKEVMAQFSDDDVPGLAAEIAYHLVFSLAPLLIFIISLAVIVDSFTGVDVSGELQDLITEHAPGEAQDVLETLVQNAVTEASGGFASFGAIMALLIALWSASSGVATLMKAFNRAYDVPEARTFVKKKLVSIGLTVLMAVFIIFSFVLFVFGGDIGELVADWFGLGSAFNWAWNIARFPLALIAIMTLLALLYYFGPNIEQSFRWISPGSVIATLLWIVAVFGFQIYLALADPGSAYGVFGGLIVLLFFFYVTGIIFLIGAEINAVIGRQNDPATVQDMLGGRAPAELPEDTRRRTSQFAPRRRPQAVTPVVLVEDTSESGSSRKTRALALGAVTAAALAMVGNKIRGIFGK